MEGNQIWDYIGPELQQVRELVRASLSSDIRLLNQTNDNLLQHNGKMVRPVLALLVAKACSQGIVTPDTLLFACAVELMHNATLLHDDVADNSPVRRGQPTVMSILGGRASVLLGDFWLVKAVERILQARNNAEAAVRIFAATLSDLAEGEMLQLQKAETLDATENDYYRIIYNKTASLFEAAATTAAMSVGASTAYRKAVKTYAVQLGTAFQIRDDILDVTGGVALGKPTGQDLLERKMTLPLLGALANCPARSAEIRELLRQIPACPTNREAILDFIREHDGLAYAERKLEGYRDMAVFALRELPEGPAREALADLADFIVKREK